MLTKPQLKAVKDFKAEIINLKTAINEMETALNKGDYLQVESLYDNEVWPKFDRVEEKLCELAYNNVIPDTDVIQ